jgi:ATP-dependent Clp protease ATP-binding subunit ClpB
VLDDGRLTDNKGRTVNFKNTIIIMTSNVGSHIIQEDIEKLKDKSRDLVLEETKQKVLAMLKHSIRPEFINRIDELVMFTPLTIQEIEEVVRLQFGIVKAMLHEQNINIELTDSAAQYIAKIGFDPHYGARPVKRIIQKEILNKLSKEILANTLEKEKIIRIDLKGDKLIFNN